MAVAESPADVELRLGAPLVGPSGKMWDKCLSAAGLPREIFRIVNIVPVQAPGNKFEKHDPRHLAWGLHLFRQELKRACANGLELIVTLGNNPLHYLLPGLPFAPRYTDDEKGKRERSRIGVWRGSLLPWAGEIGAGAGWNSVADYERLLVPAQPRSGAPGVQVLPTYHPAAVLRQFAWHRNAIADFKKVRKFLNGEWEWPREREWFVNDLSAVPQLLEAVKQEQVVSFDTEMWPYPILAFTTEDQVHVFEWDERWRSAVEEILQGPALKIAHNIGHDLTFVRERFGIEPERPYYDTAGGAHVLHCAERKTLSPDISTRYTSWPYHKWLVNVDPKRYCGYDTVVPYDAYWVQLKELIGRGLLPVAQHDHKLLTHLLQMQWDGFRVDEPKRAEAVKALTGELEEATAVMTTTAVPIAREKIDRFRKPHLFRVRRKCLCCGGGSVSREHCWRCGGLKQKPKRKEDYTLLAAVLGKGVAKAIDFDGSKQREFLKTHKVSELRDMLPRCAYCGPDGKRARWLPIKPASEFQIADLLYRGLRLEPRKYKGKETVRRDQLESLRHRHPLVEQVIQCSEVAADLTTMKRLEPDEDGKAHCVFDPWGTESGRVAGSEGLIQRGTNPMNIPKKHRYVVRADDDHLLIAPDKSQIEARCIAVTSQDAGLMRAFAEPINWPGNSRHGTIDSHTRVRQMLDELGVKLSRDQCKRLTFALFYGATPKQLAIEMNAEVVRKGEGGQVTHQQMLRATDAFFRQFRGVRDYHLNIVDQILRTRKVKSITGREREWPSYVYDGRKKSVTKKIKKQGYSFPPQDMAAWVLAEGLHALTQLTSRTLCKPLIHVHDELVIQIPKRPRLREEATAAIRECLTMKLWGMEFPCDVGKAAANWKEAKDG
jgi:uracil-DNA glycosylase